jgi:hypothetical protein
MPAASPQDIAKVAEGYKGSFYWNGQKIATCTQWHVDRTVRRDGVQVLDDDMEYSKRTNSSYSLTFEHLTISHKLVKTLLDADEAGDDPALRFIGVERRGDNAEAQWIMNDCYSDGDLRLGGAETGTTRRQTFTWRLNSRPVLQGGWDV